jgi:hypothetical protein
MKKYLSLKSIRNVFGPALVTLFLLSGLALPDAAAQRKIRKRTAPAPAGTKTNTSEPVKVVNRAETGYLSGEARVSINPKQPTIIRLGLAQNAVSIVEFPAADGIYYIHEGNPKLVSVFQSPTKETDRSITIYPGETFVAEKQSGTPLAAITMQMRSGLVIVLEFVPVADIGRNAHRCVVAYDRDEVVSARRAAGLAYDLGNISPASEGENRTRAASKLVTENKAAAKEAAEIAAEKQAVPSSAATSEGPAGVTVDLPKRRFSRAAGNSERRQKSGLELSRFVNRELAKVLKDPVRALGKFSGREGVGLRVAVSGVKTVDSEHGLIVVAVRNDSPAEVRLENAAPRLQIRTAGEDQPKTEEEAESTYVETTSLGGVIAPNSTVFYAIVFRNPPGGRSLFVTAAPFGNRLPVAAAVVRIEESEKLKE